MEYRLKALSIYEFGQRKDKEGNPHQEDWLYPAIDSSHDEQNRLFILCDGMGGHAAGEVASATVCEAMSQTVHSATQKGEKFSEALLHEAIAAAYDLLDQRDATHGSQKKMGTTMTFLMFHEDGVTIAHIGDSRVYHIRPRTGNKEDIVFQTEDHSLVNQLLKAGELTPEEAETYAHKNIITRAMQPNLEYRHKADIYTSKDILPGDYFYMCSDGMLEQTTNDNLCFVLHKDIPDEEKRDMLIRLSRDNKDNHSAHLIHVLDVQPRPETGEASTHSPSEASMTEDADDIVRPEFSGIGYPEKANGYNEDEGQAPPAVVDACKGYKDNRSIDALVWRICTYILLVAIAIVGLKHCFFPTLEGEATPERGVPHVPSPASQQASQQPSRHAGVPGTSPSASASPLPTGQEQAGPANTTSADSSSQQVQSMEPVKTDAANTAQSLESTVSNIICTPEQ